MGKYQSKYYGKDVDDAVERVKNDIYSCVFMEESAIDGLTADNTVGMKLYIGIEPIEDDVVVSYDNTTGKLTDSGAVYDSSTGRLTLSNATYDNTTGQLKFN